MNRQQAHTSQRTRRSVLQTAIAVVLALASFSCAGQIAPSGGPPDTTPPEIIAHEPATRALGVREGNIRLEFSKYVVRHTVEESAFLSPNAGKLTFDWGSTDVEIRCADTLRPNTTYILTLGTDVTDTRNNHLSRAFSLPFSTGEEIDTCLASGMVFDNDPAGIMIFAYRLQGRNRVLLNPSESKPDYLTQTGRDGSFTLPYLAFGEYRLLAVRDDYKNLLYDRGTDAYGLSASDIILTPDAPRRAGLQFQMAKEDTSPPFLSSVRALDAAHVLVRFSEPMTTTAVSLDSVALVDTATGAALPIFNVSLVPSTLLEAQIVTAPQHAGGSYRMTLSGFRDLAGNALASPQNSAVVGASAERDTTLPMFEIPGIGANAVNVPIDDSVWINFSEPIRASPFEQTFVVFDTARTRVRGRLLWSGAMAVAFIPARPLSYGTSYRIKIDLDSLVDFSGNHWTDSSAVAKFQTLDEGRVSSMKGSVLDEMPGGAGRVFLSAVNISEPQAKPRRLILDRPGEFTLEGIVEGRYVVSVFRDADSNGVFSAGLPFPHRSAERFALFPDTLKLRARWPLEGVVIRLKPS